MTGLNIEKKREKNKSKNASKSVTSPFLSHLKFDLITAMSFSHRVAEGLIFLIMSIATIIGIGMVFQVKMFTRVVNFIMMEKRGAFTASVILSIIFYYALTELRFLLFKFGLTMNKKTLNITGIVVLVIFTLFVSILLASSIAYNAKAIV